ncbi:hypothetical protein FRZ67_02720 [Panacibacter ginsenosidivorans]|uniref:Uncharacterized protein n=1 Tax=Panacibacter ginsenosidivorans TaxID=1813871 RepID=A0A5B8V4Z0_9BACT|nr:hypothetical protein [Panacibacter ginsenosidivorans]QEC66272.1 hypothetical protein FRZ67_02720 [Panacibacter ginsenosidivorans]
MKVLLATIIFCCYSCFVNAQSLKKYDIGNSGCKAYFFCDPGNAVKSYSEDSSAIYTMECNADNIHYGLICVQYNDAVLPVQDPEGLMLQYLDYLKQQFNITESAGYGKGHTMRSNEKATGVIDYWKDKDGAEWKIKSWTDGNFIGFMYVYKDGELGSDKSTKIDLFLDGFRFP